MAKKNETLQEQMKVKIISSNVRREFETVINLFISGKKVEDIKYQVVYQGDKLGSNVLYTALIMYEGGRNDD